MNLVTWESDYGLEFNRLALGEAKRLCWWLTDDRANSFNLIELDQNRPSYPLRFAPSIIVRSELGVLQGGSSPRFVFRLDLGENRGFINLRRLNLLNEILAMRYPDGEFPFDQGFLNQGWKTIKISELKLESDVSVADCYLGVPARFSKLDYKFTLARISDLFGETSAEQAYEGVPYVRSPKFGAGRCAQACCYVVSLLLHKYVENLEGLEEISCRAAFSDSVRLPVQGLTQEQMVQYLRSVGLSAVWQMLETALPMGTGAEKHSLYIEECLNAYISSGFPVIGCLDSAKIPYSTDTERVKLQHPEPQQRGHHAVVFVGCKKWRHLHTEGRQLRRSLFFYQDSRFMPFTPIDMIRLRNSGYAGSTQVNEGETTLPYLFPNFIPVTPPGVTIPLLEWKHSNHDEAVPGLLYASKFPQAATTPYILDQERRVFRLVQTGDKFNFVFLLEFIPDAFKDAVAVELKKLKQISVHVDCLSDNNHWVWLEVGVKKSGAGAGVNRLIKVWDAEGDVRLLPGNVARLLIGVLDIGCPAGRPAWKWFHPRPAGQNGGIEITAPAPAAGVLPVIDESPVPPAGAARLRPAVITSFDLLGSHAIQKLLPPDCKHIEYYASMRGDLKSFFPGYTTSSSALHTFSSACARPGEEKRFADELRGVFAGRQIISIASFFPELGGANQPVRQDAVKALQFLVKVARELKQDAPAQPFVVEFVSGSRIHSFAQDPSVQHGSTRSYLMWPHAEYQTYVREFMKILAPVADEAAAAGNIFLAAELEPGALFQINSARSLETLCEALEAPSTPESVRRVTGVNLDIPHWAFLAKANESSEPQITLKWLKESQAVLNRVVHAHISNHSVGHLSDLALTQKDAARFLPWLNLLREEAARPNRKIPLSGYVSLELEACKFEACVKDSFNVLAEWLAR